MFASVFNNVFTISTCLKLITAVCAQASSETASRKCVCTSSPVVAVRTLHLLLSLLPLKLGSVFPWHLCLCCFYLCWDTGWGLGRLNSQSERLNVAVCWTLSGWTFGQRVIFELPARWELPPNFVMNLLKKKGFFDRNWMAKYYWGKL
jgi:hypothetical protein